MSENQTDIQLLRDLAKQYAEIAAKDVQEKRRELWRAHYNLEPVPPPIHVATDACAWEVVDRLQCKDPFWQGWEMKLRRGIAQDAIGDDVIIEPWLSMEATHRIDWLDTWGVRVSPPGKNCFEHPPLKDLADIERMTKPVHDLDEEATQRDYSRVRAAIGDIVEIDLQRRPLESLFAADISTFLALLRGMTPMMMDMIDNPEWLHRVLAIMRDGILENQAQAVAAGHWSLTLQYNQAATYARRLPAPRANTYGVDRKDVWCFMAAQEYTLVSPAMHDEFLLQYQLPITANFGLVHYGCCEDLTRKIDILRKIPNLRSIAVAPVANLAECARQIGSDYCMSWRPNPAEMVSLGFNEAKVRNIIRRGLEVTRGGRVHVNLKDVTTLQGDRSRLARWVALVREEIGRVYG